MRCTQYVGLIDSAHDFLAGMEERPNMFGFTPGMFDEPVPLAAWEDVETGKIYKEVVQAAPWSSGPMIFTCLEDESGERMFEWIQDRDYAEFDRYAGRFWV